MASEPLVSPRRLRKIDDHRLRPDVSKHQLPINVNICLYKQQDRSSISAR